MLKFLKSWRCLLLSLHFALSLDPPPVAAQTIAVLPQVQRADLSLTSGETSEADPPPEFRLGTPGICRLYNLSGYLAVAADGQLLPLKPFCQQQRNWVWYEESRFWQRFRDAATVETLAFTQTLNRHEVEAYALSICPFLEDGGLLPELRQIQADHQFPPEFEQAVTEAAVRTYCRRYRSQL